MNKLAISVLTSLGLVFVSGCGNESVSDGGATSLTGITGETGSSQSNGTESNSGSQGDGDGDTNTTPGDGDGDTNTTTPGDGDGDPGDGDGDPTTSGGNNHKWDTLSIPDSSEQCGGGDSDFEFSFLWAANSSQGTISKIDTK